MAHNYHGHAHYLHFHFFSLPEEVRHFYYFSLIRTALWATGGLFLPIYIFSKTQQAFHVFLFLFFLGGLPRVLTKPIELAVMKRYSVEFSLFLSIALAGLTFFLAYYLPLNTLTVILLGFVDSFSLGFYWNAFHVSFGLFGKFREVGEEMGGLVLVQNLLAIVLPPVSSVAIETLGFHRFYLLIFLFSLGVSVLLLRHIGRTYAVDVSFEKALKAPLRKMHIVEGLMHGFIAAADVFTYIILGSAVLLFGTLKLFVNLFSSLTSYAVGYLFDRKLPLSLGRVMYLFNGVGSALVALIPAPITAALGDFLRTVGSVFHTPLAGTLYILARNGYPELTISRSLHISVGRGISLLFLMAVSPLMDNELVLRLSFAMALLSSLIASIYYQELLELSRKYLGRLKEANL